MVRRRGMLSGLRTPANIRLTIQTTSSAFGRKVGTYPLLSIQTCLVQWPYRLGFVLLWCLLMASSLILLVSCLGWPQYLFGIPWTLGIFLSSPWTHICLDSVSYCITEGYQRFLEGRSSGRPLVCFLPTYRPHKLAHSFQSDVQTVCSSAFGTWRPHSWVRMASLCSKRDPDWLQMKTSPDPPHSVWYDCNQRMRP